MKHTISFQAVRGVLAAMLSAGLLSGCLSSSGSTPTAASSPSNLLAGNVIDGYVRNATVTAYSDKAMTAQIGSGSTDAKGNFSITLTAAAPPSDRPRRDDHCGAAQLAQIRQPTVIQLPPL